ncbi:MULTISPECIES: hypothetical protein [unclassified Pseudomonas]|uniref:hypothetical protein n=1 Tax=unclassified Pseudomonas TaxID=196821 RepID=UPI0011AFCD4D|nr:MULTISPECIES: hypothetical protein [unclassified Pseudomonas]
MKMELHEMGLGLRADWIISSSSAFRPSSWPPAKDWPVSIDRDGSVLSRWGDPVWDLTPIAGTAFKLNFGDGSESKSDSLDPENANLLRLVITWRMWGYRAIKAAGSLQTAFTMIRSVIALCSRNSILACDMMRFPKLIDQLPEVIAPSRYHRTIAELNRLYDARVTLGFTIIDQDGLKRLASIRPDHNTIQTPYIPPRIWVYQVNRLSQCIDDFLANLVQIEDCFRFCLDAYICNYGSLPAALERHKATYKAPFTKSSEKNSSRVYRGSFAETLERFGLMSLLVKWLGAKRDKVPIKLFSSYLSMVTIAGLAYIANFTLQRREEVASLRASCLEWENDEKLGRVPIICGETTKTYSDSDARWVASPSVEKAIIAITAISRMRMICDRVNPLVAPTANDIDDPYLFSVPSEPWGAGKVTAYYIRHEADSLVEVIRHYPCLFEPSQLRVTHDDLKIAKQLTPNLPIDRFAVGRSWPLAWHQYRRTSAVNMFASGLISDSSMQQQMKHCSRLMPLYYGRGYTRLHLNETVEAAVVTAMYEAMAAQLRNAASNRFVSPYSADHKRTIVVSVLNTKDVKTLAAWAKSGKVSFREHRLGGCMKAGMCEYGGVESIARCAGGDSGKPCPDVLFDRTKESQVQADIKRITEEMSMLPEDSPRYQALLSDRLGMENYLNVIHTS